MSPFTEQDFLRALLASIEAISDRLWPEDEMRIRVKSEDGKNSVWLHGGGTEVLWFNRAEQEAKRVELLG